MLSKFSRIQLDDGIAIGKQPQTNSRTSKKSDWTSRRAVYGLSPTLPPRFVLATMQPARRSDYLSKTAKSRRIS